MAPSAIAEVQIQQDTLPQVTSPVPRHVPPPRPRAEPGPARSRAFFSDALLENHNLKSTSKSLDLLVALLFHVVVIGGPILAGLYYTDTINLKAFATTLLVAPGPPPPPRAPAASVVETQPPKRMLMNGGKLIAPRVIPRQIAQIKEAPLEWDGVGGVVGGVPGGQMGGVIGGVLGGIPNTAAKSPAPPTAKSSEPVRVGGRVRPPKAIVQVVPDYPVLAKHARIQGQVLIDAVLDEEGNVVDMKIVSGHPLLYQAALDALKQWKYEPTYLDEKPVAIKMTVTITFQLE